MDNEKFSKLINKYIEYYKKIYPDKPLKNMFDEINYDVPTSTNHIMEIFYEDLLKYNNFNNDIYESIDDIDDIDINKVDDLFLLNIDNNPKYVSQSVLSLLILIVKLGFLCWFNTSINILLVTKDCLFDIILVRGVVLIII